MLFFIYSTFNKITSFPWKLNRHSYGVQFGINCTALDQSKLSNIVECTINSELLCSQSPSIVEPSPRRLRDEKRVVRTRMGKRGIKQPRKLKMNCQVTSHYFQLDFTCCLIIQHPVAGSLHHLKGNSVNNKQK